MEKLLHERLREYDNLTTDFRCGDTKIVSLWKHQARALADEIERCYIPRHRIEDGEPDRRICNRTCEECAVPSLTAALKDAVQVEQRCQQLEQTAKDLLSCVSRWAPRGVYFGFSRELEALGVSLDG